MCWQRVVAKGDKNRNLCSICVSYEQEPVKILLLLVQYNGISLPVIINKILMMTYDVMFILVEGLERCLFQEISMIVELVYLLSYQTTRNVYTLTIMRSLGIDE